MRTSAVDERHALARQQSSRALGSLNDALVGDILSDQVDIPVGSAQGAVVVNACVRIAPEREVAAGHELSVVDVESRNDQRTDVYDGVGAEEDAIGIDQVDLPVGLHAADVHKLVEVLQRLVDSGNSVLIIEHNLDIVKTADYIIDLGPEGGERGGQLIASGTPEEICEVKKSYTGQVLKEYFKGYYGKDC